jgi:hypothetical protein
VPGTKVEVAACAFGRLRPTGIERAIADARILLLFIGDNLGEEVKTSR